MNLAPVFPVLFKLYDGSSFGTFKLHNLENSELSDVTVDFYVASYMDNPTRLAAIPKLEAKAQAEVQVKALFSESVLKITEATKVSAKITVNFVFEGQPYTREFSQVLRINNRNNLTWDDTRKAAAFVTPNDPLVLALGKSAVSVTSDVPSGQIDKWFVDAMALHEALRAKGLRYSTNPNTPFSNVLHNAAVVDSVWFRRSFSPMALATAATSPSCIAHCLNRWGPTPPSSRYPATSTLRSSSTSSPTRSPAPSPDPRT